MTHEVLETSLLRFSLVRGVGYRHSWSFVFRAVFCLCVSALIFRSEALYYPYDTVKKSSQKYSPTWESLDKRPAPEWFDNDKIGVFMHFGLYSVPAFGSEWFWYYLHDGQKAYVDYMKKNYPEGFKYQDFATLFKCPFFDAAGIANMVASSGARYFIITSKHHEGFTLWPSTTSWNWNSVDAGPHIDIVGSLRKEMKLRGIKFCVYISLLDWYHPDYLEDMAHSFNTSKYVKNVLTKQLYELVNNYMPDCIWSDGDWPPDSNYFQTKEFLAWLFTYSPVKDFVVVNDRWGTDSDCKHGTFRNCQDRFQPDRLLPFKWENAFTVDTRSWGHRKNMSVTDVLTVEDIVHILIKTNSYGGNSAVNVGPSGDGSIEPIFQDRLMRMGEWLKVNGESIFNSTPFRVQREGTNIYYSASKSTPLVVYASFLGWPASNKIVLTAPIVGSQLNSSVHLLGVPQPLKFEYNKTCILVDLPNHHTASDMGNAWVLRLDGFT